MIKIVLIQYPDFPQVSPEETFFTYPVKYLKIYRIAWHDDQIDHI